MSTSIPTTMRDLHKRIKAAGLYIRAGGRHHHVLNEEGKYVVSLPISPSDRRSIANVTKTLTRRGYDI